MISYSQCWEDTNITLQALNIEPGDSVLSVTSGGCNTISILNSGANHIYAIDKNETQNYLLELKIQALKYLQKEDAIRFLGYQPAKNRLKLFQILADKLSNDCRNYWNNRTGFLKTGIVHCGKFEKYLLAFQRFILPLIHSKKKRHELLTLTDPQAKHDFYYRKWNTAVWRFFFNLFFSRPIISRLGRSADMYSQNNKNNLNNDFFKRIEHGFLQGKVYQNYYLSYQFFGTKNNLLPDYLKQPINSQLFDIKKVTFIHAEILDFLLTIDSDSIDKFNLSDVFESLHIYTSNALFYELFRTAKPGARIVFWNNLLKRDVPVELTEFFIRDVELEEKLKLEDRIFFYDQFYIYTVKK
jgi:S-adenosylmethionine-diacylglycerol 3-amino-3-carboxypropyl transferase